jgi:heme/copper-type cytochrome/quinol oxidase subunit 3
MTTVPLEVHVEGRPPAWWGMLGLIATESALFATLVATYFYLRAESEGGWPPVGIDKPSVTLPVIATLVLVPSSAALVLAIRRPDEARIWICVAIALGLVFLALEAWVIRSALDDVRPQTDAYGSIFFTLGGLHWAHVAAGVLIAAWALSRTWIGPTPVVAIAVTALYWHFTNALAVALLVTLTLSPHL